MVLRNIILRDSVDWIAQFESRAITMRTPCEK